MKDFGLVKKILGMKIRGDRWAEKLLLTQGYVQQFLEQFNMHDVKPTSTPFAAHFRLSPQLNHRTNDKVEYMSII